MNCYGQKLLDTVCDITYHDPSMTYQTCDIASTDTCKLCEKHIVAWHDQIVLV